MVGISSSVGKSSKQLAQDIARKIVKEPLEVLKTAGNQVAGGEAPKSLEDNRPVSSENNQKNVNEAQVKANDNLKSVRRMEALNRELSDIQKQDLFDDLQKRIASGEEIPLEDYPQLTMEQKQVLKAQMEAVKIQNAKVKSQNEGQLVEPVAKKGRQLFNFGKKTAMKREQTHVEKIVPPSG